MSAITEISNISGRSQDEANPGTLAATAGHQSSTPSRDANSCRGDRSSRVCPTVRGYSDSALPAFRASNGPVGNGCAHDASTTASVPPPSSKIKARQHLQLPCFRALGISSRPSDALLTPPEEEIIGFQLNSPQNAIIRSSSYPSITMPKTPSPEQTDFTTVQRTDPSITESSSPNQTNMSGQPAQQVGKEFGTDSQVDSLGWIAKAVDAAIVSVDHVVNDSIQVIRHSQPNPLANNSAGVGTPTAFNALMSGIQDKIGSDRRWLHVYYAVPDTLTISQIPSSSGATPNSGITSPDYFGLQTNVFSSFVKATSHQDALEASIPSSPNLMIPPGHSTVALLERFIPPTTVDEYLHLFSTDSPSCLVDRLHELSPNNGSLIFIYPTKLGAKTFEDTYLGPLLHPQIRTMIANHNLSWDFGASVGKVTTGGQMLHFSSMYRKIQILLHRLSNTMSNINTRQAKYTLIESSTERVQLDRKTWAAWWVAQEMSRIRADVDRYMQRGIKLPSPIGGREVTAASLVREVLDGVQTGKEYNDNNDERSGVEVGVFVIRRTA